MVSKKRILFMYFHKLVVGGDGGGGAGRLYTMLIKLGKAIEFKWSNSMS